MKEIVGYHITNDGIVTSRGDRITEPPFIGFLVDKYPDAIKVFYDLDGSVGSLLKLINIKRYEAEKLTVEERIFIGNGYKIVYFPEDYFAVDYGYKTGVTASFANMNKDGFLEAHYADDNSLDDAYLKAKEAEKTAYEVHQAYKELGMLPGSHFDSPWAAFRKQFKINWPTKDDYPKRVDELAYYAVKGPFFQSYAIGHFKKAIDYDLNTAYGACLAALPDVRYGYWIEGNVIPDNAVLGIAAGELSTEADLHPFLVSTNQARKTSDDEYYTPTGTYTTTLTLAEIRFLNKWELGNFKITEGHWWIANKLAFHYQGLMAWLHSKKQESSGRKRAIITRLYSSAVGKQLEFKSGKFGEMFNALIAQAVESNTRLKVIEACLANNIMPLAVMADGMITNKKLNLPISNKMGDWKVSAEGKCIIAGSGAVTFQGDRRPRELALDYDLLVKQIKDNPDESLYIREKKAPFTLKLALQHDFSKLGQIETQKRTLNIGSENKRMYIELPATGRELLSGRVYKSIPYDYDTLVNIGKEYAVNNGFITDLGGNK